MNQRERIEQFVSLAGQAFRSLNFVEKCEFMILVLLYHVALVLALRYLWEV